MWDFTSCISISVSMCYSNIPETKTQVGDTTTSLVLDSKGKLPIFRD